MAKELMNLEYENQGKKSFEELEFPDDFMFFGVMVNHPEHAKTIAELAIGREIGEISEPVEQFVVKEAYGSHGVRFDVFFKDETGKAYDLEMQRTHVEILPLRMRYYQGMTDLRMLRPRKKYRELKDSYIIFICLENPFPESGRHLYTIQETCLEDPQLRISSGIHKIVLSAEGAMDDVSGEMKAFLRYLISHTPESDFTKELDRAVEEVKRDEQWRQEYMLMWEHDEDMMEKGRAEERAKTEFERQRADAAENRAEEEKARADAAEKRMAELEKRLRELERALSDH